MRLLSVKNALLVSAFLSNLPPLALGAPVAQTGDLQVLRRGDDSSTQHWQIETTTLNPRDEDEDVDDLETRAFRPTRPDPPPPPPPRPNPRPPSGPATNQRPRPPPRPVTPPRPDPPPAKPDWAPIADNVNPGQGEGKGSKPKPMDTYESDGKNAVSTYQSTVKSGKEDTKIVDPKNKDEDVISLLEKKPPEAFLDIRELKDQYQVQDRDVLISDLKELKNFQSGELGFDIKASGLLRQTVVNTADGRQLINRGTYDKQGQFIAYQDAFKEADTADKKVPLNEMGLQNFKTAAGDNTNKLKAAFLMDVQNKEFWGIIRNNYNDMKQPFDQVLTFKSGTPQFDRIMGSPNFKSKFFAFGNHHNDIGDPVPDKVIVIPKDAPNSANKLTVAVVFKDADAA